MNLLSFPNPKLQALSIEPSVTISILPCHLFQSPRFSLIYTHSLPLSENRASSMQQHQSDPTITGPPPLTSCSSTSYRSRTCDNVAAVQQRSRGEDAGTQRLPWSDASEEAETYRSPLPPASHPSSHRRWQTNDTARLPSIAAGRQRWRRGDRGGRPAAAWRPGIRPTTLG